MALSRRLLERDAEVSALLEAVAAAERGDGSFVLLAGEAGSGKTSLVRELRARARTRIGLCEPLSVPAPLSPLRELTTGEVAFDTDDRVALALALRAALVADGPLVAVIEDAHWADPATLDVLRALARRIEDVPLAVVVTYRDDEVRGNPRLAAFVGDVATSPALRRIHLPALSLNAIRTLAEPAGADPVELMHLTGGNPFLVVEAIEAAGALPASVREATMARVARLDEAARPIVEAAAILGVRVPLALLRAVVPHEPSALDDAVDHGVLMLDEGALGFRHELTRRAILHELSAARAADLHARALAALEPDGDPARLAHHAEEAGLHEEAARYALAAATAAERVGALAEASLQLERALRVAVPPEQRFELLLRYARATNFAGGMEDARVAATDAVALAERHLDAREVARALGVLSWSLWSLDRVVDARVAAARATDLLAASPDRDYVTAIAAELRLESIAFDARSVVDRAPAAIELAGSLEAEEARVDILISLGLARGHLGEADAIATLLDALQAARQAGLPFQTIRAYVNAVDVAVETRSHALVDRLSAEALRELEAFQTPIPAQTVQFSVARSLLDRGRFDDAVELAKASRRDRHGNVPIAYALEGIVEERRGGVGQALLAAAAAELADVPRGWRHTVVDAWRAEAAWLRGDGAHPADVGTAYGRAAAELATWHARLAGDWDSDWRGEVERWRTLDAPYESALAALPGSDAAAADAVATLRRLGAERTARAFQRERKRLGFAEVRGPRPTTLANPAGLTRREQEVLEHVARGLTNGEIAAMLHLSERTVSHHVSAILSKLDAPNRTAAVEIAGREGLLQHGTAPGPT